MNTLISFFIIQFVMMFSAPSPEKTVQNLKDAYLGESTASAKYAAYSEQAKKDGYTRIATLFLATSKSEAIHAANHKAVLEKMGEKMDAPKLPEIKVNSTLENLEDAYKGESYEVNTMYPGFVTISRSEDVPQATKSFTWAKDTEKKHMIIYSQAIDALKANKENTLSGIYYVCPKCGNTYNVANPEKTCSFCMTPNSKFIKFGA